MRQVREVLGLRTAGVGLNEVARRVGVAPSTVRLTLKRLATAGLTWPLPAEMTDSAGDGPVCCCRHQARPSGVTASPIGLRCTASSSASTSL